MGHFLFCLVMNLPYAVPLLLILQSSSSPRSADAYTVPEQRAILESIRDTYKDASPQWKLGLSTWNCPTDPLQSDQPCDPCSTDYTGNWDHINCRGPAGTYGEGSDGVVDGLVTSIHMTDMKIGGPIVRDWCKLKYIREFDLDGNDHSGSFPEWPITDCFPKMQEFDLSFNKLTGTIPASIGTKKTIGEIKMEHNLLSGSLTAAIGDIPGLWRLRLSYNNFKGKLPENWRQLHTLRELEIENNQLSGDLSVLSGSPLEIAKVHNNPGLCGDVPESVKKASGYDPSGTRLGQPC